MTKPRKYTGNTDPHPKTRPGTKQFQDLMVFLFGMKNLGIFANRPVRGGKGLSVHATGRACDLGGTPKQCKEATAFLYDFRYDLGIEEIHDYVGNYMATKGFGAIDLGLGGTWVQTSYNTRGGVHTNGGTPLRKNYAGIGYTYDPARDAFIPPKPFDSWILNEDTCLWDAPTPYPTDGGMYYWDEGTLAWVAVEVDAPAE